jgi:hypothetical protein
MPGALVSDSRGIYDAATTSVSPQKGLRSSRGGAELEAACEQCARSGAAIRWVHGGAMLGDILTKRGNPARATITLFLQGGQKWRLIRDPKFESQCRRMKKGLARLIEGDDPQDHDTKEEKAYAIEDGWAIDVEAPWDTAARQMVQRAQDAAREPRVSVLGDNFALAGSLASASRMEASEFCRISRGSPAVSMAHSSFVGT